MKHFFAEFLRLHRCWEPIIRDGYVRNELKLSRLTKISSCVASFDHSLFRVSLRVWPIPPNSLSSCHLLSSFLSSSIVYPLGRCGFFVPLLSLQSFNTICASSMRVHSFLSLSSFHFYRHVYMRNSPSTRIHKVSTSNLPIVSLVYNMLTCVQTH